MSTVITGLRHNEDGTVSTITLLAPEGTPPSRPRRTSNWLPATLMLERIAPEYAAIRKAAADALEAGQGQMMMWIDTLTANGGVDITSAASLAAKTAFVQAGLLTQPRADAVFAPVER